MRRLLTPVLAALAPLVSALTLAPAAQAADFPFTTVRTNAVSASRCFGPLNGGQGDGTPVVLMECSQLWHGTGGNTPDRSVRHFGGKCLGLAGGSTANGTALVLRTCGVPVAGDQQWTFVALNPGGLDGIWVLRNQQSLKCANLAGGGTASGTRLVLQPCSFRADQQWRLPNEPVTYGFAEDNGLA
ncbi:RICIN domain-containing protein [Actinomadura fibrosa]|uniref:RICIN domain-containing protein n=1 Tax=Actinomadura fibrosa TaxID=111802 RepID=A0ABW2Y6L1_9ACTN|nr:RICIN domain-containing protein [Actinomadura fibrosa]